MNYFRTTCLFIGYAAFVVSIAATSTSRGTGAETHDVVWQLQTFPALGIEVDVPSWGIVRSGSEDRWLLLGFPVADRPVTTTQFAITISIAAYPKAIHEMAFPLGKHDENRDVNCAYAEATTIDRKYDIYVVRDVPAAPDKVYRCIARLIKSRTSLQQLDDVRRVLSSITPIEPVRPTED